MWLSSRRRRRRAASPPPPGRATGTRTKSAAPALLPLVGRPGPEARPAPVLFVSAPATWQAYNSYGGKSLYQASSHGFTVPATGHTEAAIVSFDRPYGLDSGAGHLRRHEIQFVRWMEREGRAVDYAADVDLELNPDIAANRELIVFAGHHEYWSRPMRARLGQAIAAGTNIAFLSANEVYWQIRLGDSPLGPGRRVTCYRSAQFDPVSTTTPALTTVRWREDPVAEPEARLVGQMYGHIVERVADWVVVNPAHWLYEGTGLRRGDRIVNLIGSEYDTFFPEFAPPGTELLAHSPVIPDIVSPHAPCRARPSTPPRSTSHRQAPRSSARAPFSSPGRSTTTAIGASTAYRRRSTRVSGESSRTSSIASATDRNRGTRGALEP